MQCEKALASFVLFARASVELQIQLNHEARLRDASVTRTLAKEQLDLAAV